MKPSPVHKVKSLLSGQHLDLSRKRTILAVSGGVDSIVLAKIFRVLGFDFAIAHCNFQLRGVESDGDMQLVNDLAQEYKVPFYHTLFDTAEYMVTHKVSVQVAARELRYAWFEQVRKEQKYDYIATAHHLNDNIETVLYNFIKGTGVKGLRGMLAKQDRLIRPLLAVSREEILDFQQEYHLAYREDSSNTSDKYSRNKIRHHLIPLIEEINPGFQSGFSDKLKIFADLENVYENKIRRIDKQLFQERKGDIYIPILKLKKLTNKRSILFEYLQPHGFNASQVDDILDTLDGESGRSFLSPQARIIKDRQFLILTALGRDDFTAVLIEEGDSEVQLPNGTLHVSKLKPSKTPLKKEHSYAYLDLDKLEFPLLLRQWKLGDYFYPLGMGMKKKKVSKYFKDRKIPIHEKESVWILESNKKIAWIVGERIDERFKLHPNTKSILMLHI